MKKKTVFVVAHSHWDHEWYFTYEDADIILIKNLDFLINCLESDEDFICYSFDGQYSVIEKYLEIRPENKERVAKLVKNKRLFIGPWFTQADVLLGKTESVIRNLQYGIRGSNKLGHTMNIGYAPDVFGQHAYLPSIYKRLGIEYSIFQRGVYNEQVADNLNFLWEAPNGEVIKANNIFFGYGPGKFLSADKEYVSQRLLPILDELSTLNKNTDNILLPAGGDQVIVNRDFPNTVNELNQISENYHFELSDYESFMKEAWYDSKFSNKISGELTACQKSRIHNTCRSERYDIKVLNYKVEDLLINELEPLISIGARFGLEIPQKWMDDIWKKIFKSQAHNGIGASNSDDANHDIVDRLRSTLREIQDIINILKKQITSGIQQENLGKNILVLFNTLAKKSKYQGLLTVFTKEKNFELITRNSKKVDYIVHHQAEVDGGKRIIVTSQGEKEEKVPNYYKTEIWLDEFTLPAMGFTTLIIEKVTEQAKEMQEYLDTFVENDYFKIVNKGNNISVYDKKTNQEIENAFVFDDVADAGDSFDFSPLKDDQAIIINEFQVVNVQKCNSLEQMEIVHKINLPQKLEGAKRSSSLKSFEIRTFITLKNGKDSIAVKHVINNTIMDHRIRVKWCINVDDLTYNYADQGFCLLKRQSANPYEETWREQGFVEKPMPIYPLENMIVLSDNKSHFSLHTGMMKEYQVETDTKELAVTLFRSNGVLGRDNLAWRPGRASGINNMIVETPDGQMIQEMVFEYAVQFGREAYETKQLYRISEEIATHQDFYQQQSLNSYLHRIDRFPIPLVEKVIQSEFSLFELENTNLFTSMCRDNGRGETLLRIFNPTNDSQDLNRFDTEYIHKKEIVNLLEEEVISENIEGHNLAPLDFITLKFS